MSAEIIMLPIVRVERCKQPSTARNALIEVALDLPNTTGEEAEMWSDWIIAELASRGFKVVAE